MSTKGKISLKDLEPTELKGLAERLTAKQVLELALQNFGDRMAIVTSFQTAGMVIIDIATRIASDVRIVTIDTGRLHEETYKFMDQVREYYGVNIEVHFPNSREVRKLVSQYGMNLFYNDVDSRQACCQVRKVHPLQRVLEGIDAWVTGLRKAQSSFRASVEKIDLDFEHGGILKLCPLADWSARDVTEYLNQNNVPQHPLHARGYPSIGCEPCTRPVKNGESSRSGRWWWEKDTRKECGIHCRL